MVLRKLERAPTWLDSDTYLSEGTGDAVRRALGCAVCLADEILETKRGAYFVMNRPPGHHAGRDGLGMGAGSLGFCVFNNAAIAASLLKRGGKVLMIDFDAHHGNGTQDIFYEDGDVIHLDIHQHPATLYPGTGWPDQTGEGRGRGTKLNVILPPGASDDIFEDLLGRMDFYLSRFSFDYIVISAGFDGFVDDGLANLRLTELSYYRLGSYISKLAEGRPILMFLEGGYSLGLERGLPAFVMGFLGSSPMREWKATQSDVRAWVKYHNWREEYEGYILGLSG